MSDDAKIKKDIYTDDEKKIVLDRLNEERLIHQHATKGLDGNKAVYDQSEKNKILNKLNDQRLSKQKCEEIKKSRTHHKEIYTFGLKKFYKFLNMEREYFIETVECDKFSTSPVNLSLYYRTFNELKKKNVLIKTEIYSDKIFISHDVLQVYYKGYFLENEREK